MPWLSGMAYCSCCSAPVPRAVLRTCRGSRSGPSRPDATWIHSKSLEEPRERLEIHPKCSENPQKTGSNPSELLRISRLAERVWRDPGHLGRSPGCRSLYRGAPECLSARGHGRHALLAAGGATAARRRPDAEGSRERRGGALRRGMLFALRELGNGHAQLGR